MRWSWVIPAVALAAVVTIAVLNVVARGDAEVRVRPQTARHTFVVHGTGTRTPSQTTQERFDKVTGRFVVGYVVGGHADPGAGYQYWVLFTKRPPDAEVAALRTLPVDVEVRYGATTSTYAAQTLGDLMIGELGKQLTLGPVESGFNDAYDAVALTYRPPAGVSDSDLARAEHAALADLAGSEPDGMLPFPVEFVRDPGLRYLRGHNL